MNASETLPVNGDRLARFNATSGPSSPPGATSASPATTSSRTSPSSPTSTASDPSKRKRKSPSRAPRRSKSHQNTRHIVATQFEIACRYLDDLPLNERIQVKSELIRRLAVSLSTDGLRANELDHNRAEPTT